MIEGHVIYNHDNLISFNILLYYSLSQLYVALFPCNDCAKIIIQSGITEVVYLCDKHSESLEVKASKKMFQMANIKTRQYIPLKNKIIVDFGVINE